MVCAVALHVAKCLGSIHLCACNFTCDDLLPTSKTLCTVAKHFLTTHCTSSARTHPARHIACTIITHACTTAYTSVGTSAEYPPSFCPEMHDEPPQAEVDDISNVNPNGSLLVSLPTPGENAPRSSAQYYQAPADLRYKKSMFAMLILIQVLLNYDSGAIPPSLVGRRCKPGMECMDEGNGYLGDGISVCCCARRCSSLPLRQHSPTGPGVRGCVAVCTQYGAVLGWCRVVCGSLVVVCLLVLLPAFGSDDECARSSSRLHAVRRGRVRY